MKKILLRVVIGALALIIIGIFIVGLFLGDIVKQGVQTVGPKIAGVDIKLNHVGFSLLSGSVNIKGLVVGNPEGYKTPEAISVGTVSVSVKPGSLLSDKVVIPSIHVEAPEITLEGSLHGNNLSKILDNVKAATGSTDKSGAATSGGEKPSGKKLEVDDFLITGGKIHLSITGMGGKSATVPLPEIHLTDLGKNSGGITAADLTKRVLEAITESATKAAAGALTDIGKNAAGLTKEAGQSVSNATEKITKGIGNLFKK